MTPVRSELRSKRLNSGMLELGDEHGRHAVERGTPLRLNRFERGQRVELGGGQHQSRAVRQRHHHADDAAEAVVERHGRADAVAAG